MSLYLPYIVSIMVAFISGIVSYVVSVKKSKSDIEALKEANRHDLTKLMEQHKMDIDSLERKHQMEVEKIELEHKHAVELKQKELESNMGTALMSSMMDTAMKMPEVKNAMSQSFKNKRK